VPSGSETTLARRSIVTKAIGCSHAAASFLILVTFASGVFMVGSTPAMAADDYGCRGDKACVKIAERTKCDALCQHACREIRFDYEGCYSTYGPKFEYQRAKLGNPPRSRMGVRYEY
jgi:hypothetical protein